MAIQQVKLAATVRLSAAAAALLKQTSVELDTNATANVVHALKFR